MPRNPNLSFLLLFLVSFISYAYVLTFFYYDFQSLLWFLLVCLSLTWWIRVSFLFLALIPWTCIHMSMHWCIGTVVQQGKWDKSCIHMNMHMELPWWWMWTCFVGWYALDVLMISYACLILICPCFYHICLLPWMIWDKHDRCMLGFMMIWEVW